MADNIRNLFLDFLNNELENLEINNLEDNPGVKKKASQEFIDKIEGVVGIDDKVCNICFDTIKLEEECIKLPCDGNHFFHKNETESCGGIIKWLNINNSCPCCRYEFPHEEYRIECGSTEDVANEDMSDEVDRLDGDEQIIHVPFNINNLFMVGGQPLENLIEEDNDRRLQMAIELSLEDH